MHLIAVHASGGGRLVSVSLEKVQVSVLADRINDVLDQAAKARMDFFQARKPAPAGASFEEISGTPQ